MDIARAAIFTVAACALSVALPQSLPNTERVTGAGLPNLGDGLDMAPSAERKLGDRIARELYRDPDYIDDPVIIDYVQSIWQPLLAAARLRGEITPELDSTYAWEVVLGRDRTVNAFALPGAYLGLHLGLVGVVTSRDELASVLAHELSHVTQRHISRMMARQSAQAPWLLGSMILGMLAASKNPSAANAMIVGGQAVSAQTQLNFSRDMEREADRVGFGVATQAGFASQGFSGMFEKLQQASRLNDSGNFPYLRSHPLTTERLADMQGRSPLAGLTQSAPESAQTMESSLIAARARVLSNYAVDALRVWEVEAQPAPLSRLSSVQQAGVLYGAAFAAMKLRDFAQAQTLWQRLEERTRGDASVRHLGRLLGAEIALAQEEPGRALKILRQQPLPAYGVFTRAELLLRVQAQQNSEAGLATQSLQTWLADHPRDAGAWQQLATIYAAQGRVVGAIRAQAEVNVSQLDYPAALTRLKAAQEMVRKRGVGADHIEASIVDTRTRQVEAIVREQLLER